MAGYPCLIFRLQEENFAISSETITAIYKLDRREVSEVPNSPSAVCGIINFRGTVIPLMDLRLFYNIEPSDKEIMIVIENSARQFGILVDEVLAVETIEWDETDQGDLQGLFTDNCIQSIGKRRQDASLVMLLNEGCIGEQMHFQIE